MIYTVRGFGVINKAEIDVFLELSCFSDDPADVGNWISGSSAFYKSSLNIWKFTVHAPLKPGLENFEHYFISVCYCCCCWVASVASNSVWPHRRQPTRLPVPGILQARTLEWVAIPFSSAWKGKVKVKSLHSVRLLATPWTAACQAAPSVGFSRQENWSGVPLPSPY